MDIDSRDIIEMAHAHQDDAYVEYAGFWIRFLANFIDGIILTVPLTVIFAAFIAVIVFASASGSGAGTADTSPSVALSCLSCLMYPAILIIVALYYVGFESSKYMGTPGKLILGLKVTDIDGDRLSFGKALVRFVFKTVLNMFFYVGSLYIVISDKKQGLYDVIANTLVVKKN
jgi:uncharacterized RDD family membrane protein YckC